MFFGRHFTENNDENGFHPLRRHGYWQLTVFQSAKAQTLPSAGR